MKIKTIARSADACTRERSSDTFVMCRNPDALLHPFEQAREYTRALNAVKLERTFAKPFVAALSGHTDGIYCMNRHPTDLKLVVSGSADGEIRLWDLAARRCTVQLPRAHSAFVRGVGFLPHSQKMVSCGDDRLVKLWEPASPSRPATVFQGSAPFTAIDGHRHGQQFATSGAQVDVWDVGRADPVQSFVWGADTVSSVRFNQSEVSVLASCASDRSVVLHDLRMRSSLAKVVLQMSSNALAWNPMEAVYFTAANEDYNCYTFDMRFLSRPVNVLCDHVSAVLDIDYSPTGHELVTGGYDRTIRIFRRNEGHSRDVYHTRRMQRLFCVRYSMDSAYVMSGSDDGNLRLWKARASEKLGIKSTREQADLDYSDALKERFRPLPEIKRISKHRHLPKAISSAARTLRTQREAAKRKHENRQRHSKPGAVPDRNIRKDAIVAVKK